MTTNHPTFLTEDHLVDELAAARRGLSDLLDQVREFSTIVTNTPWVYLDDLLSDLRAAATTVAVLEQVTASRE